MAQQALLICFKIENVGVLPTPHWGPGNPECKVLPPLAPAIGVSVLGGKHPAPHFVPGLLYRFKQP